LRSQSTAFPARNRRHPSLSGPKDGAFVAGDVGVVRLTTRNCEICNPFPSKNYPCTRFSRLSSPAASALLGPDQIEPRACFRLHLDTCPPSRIFVRQTPWPPRSCSIQRRKTQILRPPINDSAKDPQPCRVRPADPRLPRTPPMRDRAPLGFQILR